MNIVSNPVDALVNANYIGILAWAIIFGIALKAASETTKTVIENISDADIMNLEMATGEPVVYDFDEKLNVNSKTKLD